LRRLSQRELRRIQERMLGSLGVSLEELGRALEVKIELVDRTITIKDAVVVAVDSQAGRVYQVMGGVEVEEAQIKTSPPTSYEPSPEDVALVASQAGVDQEAARVALVESGGDLARAIISLRGRKA